MTVNGFELSSGKSIRRTTSIRITKINYFRRHKFEIITITYTMSTLLDST